MKLDPYLAPYVKIGSLWINNLNMEPRALSLLGEYTREGLHDISLGSDFLGMTPKAQETKATTDKLYKVKLKAFAN